MAYNLQEQEQIDELKAFWNRYGTAILAAVTAALLVFAGFRGWNWYQARQASAAAAIYSELVTAVEANKIEQVKTRSEDLLKSYGSTAYGQMAGLMTARAYVDADDLMGAKGALQWVIDNGQDPEFKQVARLRLAGLLLDEKSYDAALKVIEPSVIGKAGNELNAALADRRADILVGQDKRDAARTEYERALGLLPANGALRQMIELKLAVFGQSGSGQ